MSRLWTFLGCIVLASCGPLVSDSPLGQMASRFAPSQQQAAPSPEAVQAAQVAMAQREQIAFALVELNTSSRAFVAGRNGRQVTWQTANGESITLENGLLVATRGLGDDLMGANVSEARRALIAGGGEATREASFLGSQDEIIRRVFECQVVDRGAETLTLYDTSRRTTKFVETCVGQSISFENQYWIGTSGNVWQSRQWISPQIGYIDNQKL